ncbi:MAG: CDP-diacylglycerol--serine O-phosphatidyltransferase [Bryobacterales bacterium]|nr:CDP-diacylglycerol--serine O-phosphatidyltransferase [Bryobacterales bacterium]
MTKTETANGKVAKRLRVSRKAAYVLPTLFTAGNIFLGFLAILKTIQGALLAAGGDMGANPHFEIAAKSIGIAVVLDGLDGRIARMTNTVSDFGKELDSLADVITFGIAPAVLAFIWGVQFVNTDGSAMATEQLRQVGYFVVFLYLLCGSARLARFNVQATPIPGKAKPDHRFFVGLPIPAAAGLVAALVYASGCVPLLEPIFAMVWLALVGMISLLMVSTWRYISFKDLNLVQPRKPLSLVFFGALIWSIWNYSQPVLLLIATVYLVSGFVLKGSSIIRRLRKGGGAEPEPHQQPSV